MKKFSRLWHGGLAVIVAFAMIAQLALLVTGGADANSGRVDPRSEAGAVYQLLHD
jgi:hypothetical protein